MMTKYPEKASPPILRPPNSNHLTQLARRAEHGLGITQPYPQPLSHHHSLSNLGPFPLPKMHESILREMEKQQIREEIIRSEIVKMRLLKDGKMAFHGGRNNGIPFVSSSSSGIGFAPKMLPPLGTVGGGQMSLEERFLPWLDEKEKWLGGTSRGFGPSPSLRISEVKSDPEGSKEIGKTIFLGNTNDEKASGIKRKAAEVEGDVSVKKDKKWFCEVCHISATSEQALKEHMKGKKHKSAEQRAGKHYRMGMFTKKPT